jgi:hypothetical protein
VQRRNRVAAIVAAMHIAPLVVLMLGVQPLSPPSGERAIRVRAIAADTIVVPPRPTVSAPLAISFDVNVEANIKEPAFIIAEARAPDTVPIVGASDCGLGETIAAALRDDATVRQALRLVPSTTRTVANAVTLWNGEWADAAVLGGATVLEPIQNVVLALINAAPEACRTAAVTGPRLVLVTEVSETFIVSIGSGVWAWGQLLEG